MMLPRLSACCLVLLVLAAGPVAAEAGQGDPRLVTLLYNINDIVRIEGRTNVEQTIAFGENEHIENVAIGDSASWQVTPNKRTDLLFIKPLAPRARTNMTVVTDRHTYLFDLVAFRGARPVFLLRFTYPAEAKSAGVPSATAPALTDAEAQAASAAPGQRPIDPAAPGFVWRSSGSAKMLPSRVYDDGAFTYLSWAIGKPIPAILMRNEQGVEGPVNFSVRGDVIAIEGVPNVLVLRAGRENATLERHDAPPPAIAPAPANTPPSGL
jgi:type IV secretion system protein VirB9